MFEPCNVGPCHSSLFVLISFNSMFVIFLNNPSLFTVNFTTTDKLYFLKCVENKVILVNKSYHQLKKDSLCVADLLE